MFNLVKDTYVITNHNGKNHLALVSNVTASSVTVFLNADMEKDEAVLPIKVLPEMIVADLGQRPKIGNAYGTKVEPFYGAEDHEQWGRIRYYRPMLKKEKKALREALNRTFDLLESKKLAAFFPINVNIHEKSGKYLGYYKHSKKEEVPSCIGLQPPTFTDLDQEDLDYIIYHEAGHALWFNYVSSTFKAEWLKLFEKRIKCKRIKQKSLDMVLQALYNHSEYGVKDFLKNEASDEDQELVKSCMEYMKKVFRLSAHDVDILLREDNIDKYWPTQQDISRVIADVSEYSMKDCDEYFAESFSFRMIGTKLPEDVTTLLKDTLKDIRRY